MATDYYKMGLGLGGAYFDGQEDGRLRKRQMDKDARETTEYDQRQAEYTRAQGLQRKSDDAYANLDSVSAGVVDPGATGLSQPSAQMLSQGYGAAKGPQAVQDAAGDYTREANRMGMAPQQYNAQAPVTSRKASEREMLDAEMGVATATRDRGYRESLQAKGKELDWNDGRLTHGKAWDAMTEAQRAEMVTKASLDANVPGSGTWVAGEGKRAGYMWYTPPGKDPVQLSAKEAKEVFILGNLASVNPERARKETEAASDKVRAVYGHLFDSQTKGVTANNTGQHYLDSADNARTKLAQEGRYQDAMVGISRDRADSAKKEAPNPELLAKYNDLMVQSEEATDPRVRTELDQQMRRLSAQISTGMGKPMQVRSEGKAPLAPEAQQKYRDARTEMGLERPAEVVGMFGGKDDSKGAAWDAKLKNLNALYGVGAEASKGAGKAPEVKDPGRTQSATPPMPMGRVLSEAAPSRGMMGFGREEMVYNVEMPDGTTRMVSASEMGRLGYPMESIAGRLRYSPDYK